MSFQLSIPRELEATWQPIIEHQFNLMLAPLRVSLHKPRIAFTSISDPGGHRYFCELIARLPGGERLQLSGQNTDGRTAVADVFSRTRRVVSRRRWTMSETQPLSRTDAAAQPQ